MSTAKSKDAVRKNTPRERPSRAGERAARKTRLRYGTFPKPADRVEVPYAQCRESHRGLSYGDQTKRIIDSALWQAVMVPILDEIDRKRGPQAQYSAHDLESCLLFQRVAGEKGYKAARGLLAGDEHRDARRLLGFDRTRGRATRGNPERWRLRGVPSRSTISRFINEDFPREQRNAAYAYMVVRLREAIIPLLGSDARVLYMDGTKIETHYTCPKIDPKTKRVVNSTAVTCPDGGYVPPSAGADHSGHGWNAIWMGTESGLPLMHHVVKLNESEKTAAVELLADFAAMIVPLMPDEVGVITADGGFSSEGVREAVHRAGSIENIHGASHGDQPSTHRRAKQLDLMRFAIEGYPNYYANGHRELFCNCGQAYFSRVAWRDRRGRGQVCTEGDCANCGHISITAGKWRQAKNPNRYVRTVGDEVGDLQFGNPLTYYDDMAADYGNARRGRGEGPHGHTLTQRFEHLKGKRWFRRTIDAELDTNVVFTIMLALGLEDIQYRAKVTARPGGPLPAPSSTAPPPALPLAV